MKKWKSYGPRETSNVFLFSKIAFIKKRTDPFQRFLDEEPVLMVWEVPWTIMIHKKEVKVIVTTTSAH